MKKAGTKVLPFGGLGFDMSPVATRARLLVLRRVRPCETHAPILPETTVPKAAGYDLLLGLSREIRGR